MTTPAITPRHPLGLPAGSVRALLAFMVLGLMWTVLLAPAVEPVGVPLYLYYLLFLILGHYFAAHGHSIAGPTTGPRSPLYLPRGSVRGLILLGFAGMVAWHFATGGDFHNLQPAAVEQPYLPLLLLAAFLVGFFVSRIITTLVGGPGGVAPYWFQDIQAAVSLMAMLGLGAEILIQTVINPSLPAERQLHLPSWHAALAAIVAFYFGSRS